MSRKYIRQQILQDFVYPNNDVAQYDVEIVQDINNNCVNGNITSFSATTFNSTGITFSLNASYILNGAEPFNLQSGERSVLSVHMMGVGQQYFKPWRLVKNYTGSTVSTGTTIVDTFTVLPSQLGLASFVDGVYYFEFRFIGHKCILPICYTLNLLTPTPAPTSTPSPTASPTPSPTAGPITPTPTFTPTLTPTLTPTEEPCDCFEYEVIIAELDTLSATGNTGGFAQYNDSVVIEYTDCDGVPSEFIGGFPGATICADINQSFTLSLYQNNIQGLTTYSSFSQTAVECCSVTPTATPNPTATPLPTETPIGPTPTFTPTLTPTLTPTDTVSITGSCFCVTYDPVDLPEDLYVRYRDLNDTTVTSLISTLETIDNGNGTFTACLCVLQGGSYATPICVQGGLEVLCPSGIVWVQGGTCTTNGECFLG